MAIDLDAQSEAPESMSGLIWKFYWIHCVGWSFQAPVCFFGMWFIQHWKATGIRFQTLTRIMHWETVSSVLHTQAQIQMIQSGTELNEQMKNQNTDELTQTLNMQTALQQHLLQTFSCMGPVIYGQGPQSTSPWSLADSVCGASVSDSPRLWTGLALLLPLCPALCCNIVRHSPRQLSVAADVAFSSSRSWSRQDRDPLAGRDSMDWTRLFCWPSAWFIAWRKEEGSYCSWPAGGAVQLHY